MSSCGLTALALRVRQSDEGQAAAEYAVILALVAIVAMFGVGSLGTACQHLYDHILGAFSS